MHYETRARSIVKSFVWRAIATIVTGLTTYFYTGKIGESLKISFTAALISLVAYYFHERIWNSITWGKNEPKGGDIK